jgi:hypothetical protein
VSTEFGSGPQAAPRPERSPEPLVSSDDRSWRDGLHQRPSRLRTALVVLPLLGGLLACGVVGSRLLWGQVDSGEPVAATIACWDASMVVDASDCTRPRGNDGLAWVFPSFLPDRLDCRDELELHPEYTRPAMCTCAQSIGDRTVAITYSEVSGEADALRFLDKLHGRQRRGTTTVGAGGSAAYVWSPSRTGDGGWTASLLLKDGPYAATVVADLRSDASKALERRVQVRPSEELRVRP